MNQLSTMIIRDLQRHEIDEIRNIDRSEVIEAVYYYRDGNLEKEKEFHNIRGREEIELEENITELKKLYEHGGTFLGAFENEKLVGIGVLGKEVIGGSGDTLQLVFLHVSEPFRKKGIGTELMRRICAIAREKGAKKLYISATPSESTVRFYFNRGSKLAKKVDKALYEEEPEDIHFELEL
jgi:predicted N-acetyltransferase YhbS